MSNKTLDGALSATATARYRALEAFYKATQDLDRAKETLRALELNSNTLIELRKALENTGDNQ